MFKRILILTGLILTVHTTAAQEDKTKEHSQHISSPKSKKSLSPHTSTMAQVGDAHVHIDYSSPSVRDRIIFGGLVGYDRVWQAGAHNATWIETDKDLEIDGRILPAGRYGLFTIPGKEKWVVIFNSRWEQHGKDEYQEKEDVLRVVVEPSILDEPTEALVYNIKETGDASGVISLEWEKTKINVPFKVKPH